MIKQQLPKYQIFDIDDYVGEYTSLEDFWLKITESRIKSIDEKLLKKFTNMDEHITDHNKFLKKLRGYGNSLLIKKELPKYIIRLGVSNAKFSWAGVNTDSDEAKILEIFDNLVGRDQVKICPAGDGWVVGAIQLEVWLKDEDDLAAFEFYAFSNKELFFW